MDPIRKEPFPEMKLPVAGSSLPLQGDMLFNAGRQSMSKPGELPHEPCSLRFSALCSSCPAASVFPCTLLLVALPVRADGNDVATLLTVWVHCAGRLHSQLADPPVIR